MLYPLSQISEGTNTSFDELLSKVFNSVFLELFLFFFAERKGGRRKGGREEIQLCITPLGRTELTFNENNVKGSAAEDVSPISTAL